MSDRREIEHDDGSASLPEPGERGPALPEELPPVEPPSAGFIIQLFVVPALIVASIFGGWMLIRRMVSSDQDWQKLVVELRSENKHRSGRGAVALAQLLRADQELKDQGQQLARNPQIAGELAKQLSARLQSGSTQEQAVQHQAFLARTLGMLDVPETVLPVLLEAMQPDHPREVRKNGIAAVALIAGRAEERGEPLSHPGLLDDLVGVSADADPFLRQIGAYTLGLFPQPEARHRLEIMLADADRNTRINAAIGLARHGSTAGFEVFQDVLAAGAESRQLGEAGGNLPASQRAQAANAEEFERLVALINALKAIGELSEQFDADQREQLARQIEPVIDASRDRRIRIDAKQALRQLASATQGTADSRQ